MQKQGKQKGVIELRKIKAVENVEDHVLDRKTNVFQVNVQNVYSILLNMIEMQKKKKKKLEKNSVEDGIGFGILRDSGKLIL